MKATDLLIEQHREVFRLFEAIEKEEDEEEKKEMFAELAANIVAHDAIEREIFYPACEQAMGLNDDLGEALVEHGVAEFSLYQANEALDKEDFDFKCTVLKEVLEHHIEEEEKEFFPKVQKALGDDTLEVLGDEMERRFEAALEEDYQQPLYENLRQVLAGALKPGKAPARSRKGEEARKSA